MRASVRHSQARFNRLEGDSLIQTLLILAILGGGIWSFNRLEGDSLIQTHRLALLPFTPRPIVSIALRAIL